MKKQSRILINIIIHTLIALIVICFFIYYDAVPKTKNATNNKQENLEYSFKKAYYTENLTNDLGEITKSNEEEKLFCVEFSVKNMSNRDIFYVSIVEDPKLITLDNKEIYPDLSLSDDPFGNISIKKTREGFLAFRIPANKSVKTFKIGNFSKDIDNSD